MANFLVKPTLGLYDQNSESSVDDSPPPDSPFSETKLPMEKILSKDNFRTYYLTSFERQHLSSMCKYWPVVYKFPGSKSIAFADHIEQCKGNDSSE